MAEVIRVIGATFVEEGIHHIRTEEIIEEIEDTAETGVEIGAEVTSETHTRQCQRK